MIPRNPRTGVKPPAVPRKHIVPLTVAQVRKLAEQITAQTRAWSSRPPARDRGPVRSSGYSSAHLNLLQATVTVDQQMQQSKHGVFMGPPTTDRS